MENGYGKCMLSLEVWPLDFQVLWKYMNAHHFSFGKFATKKKNTPLQSF